MSKTSIISHLVAPATTKAQTDLPFPSWWNGICDTNNYSNSPDNPNHLAAYTLPLNVSVPANYRGVVACGPRPASPPYGDGGPDVPVNFFSGAFGEFEWECVELSMRYMYLAYGIPPYNAPGGKDVVTNYMTYNSNPILQSINNPTTGMEPQAGDILSYAGTKLFPSGHTSVVKSTNYTSPGNGKITVLEENFSSSGIQTLSMSNWMIGSGVTGWLHHTVDITPQTGSPKTNVQVNGSGFAPNETVTIKFDGTQIGTGTTDSTGALSTTMTIPTGATPGSHSVHLVGSTSGFSPQTVFYVQSIDWPSFGYNLQNTRYNTYENVLNTKNVSSLALDWSVTTPGGIDTTSPIIADGIAHIGDDTNTLYAYNAATGTPLWTYSLGFDNFYPSLTVVNGVAYVVDHTGHLAALNASTGVPIWTTTSPTNADASPAVVNDTIYIAGGSAIVAYNAITGGMLWKNQSFSGVASGSPAVVNNVVYVATINGGSLYALDTKTGNTLWSGSLAGGSTDGFNGSFNGPVVSNGIVYANSYSDTGGGNLFAFNASGCGSSSCSPLWIVSNKGYANSAPTVANGVLYIGSSSNGSAILYAFNAKTGALLRTWTGPGIAFNYSSAAVANGVVYDASYDGNMSAFKASGCGSTVCSPLWTYNLGTGIETDSSPTVVNGMVYIGAYNSASPSNGYLFAFHLPA